MVTVTINTGNADVQSDRDIARLLEATAKRIRRHGLEGVTKVMDANGNSVGTVDAS